MAAAAAVDVLWQTIDALINCECEKARMLQGLAVGFIERDAAGIAGRATACVLCACSMRRGGVGTLSVGASGCSFGVKTCVSCVSGAARGMPEVCCKCWLVAADRGKGA